jgi:hypothetical protein
VRRVSLTRNLGVKIVWKQLIRNLSLYPCSCWWAAGKYYDSAVEMDSGPKARQEFHMSDTVRGNAYATTRVVRDMPYAIMAQHAL